jgi:hypothetical protein
MGVRDWKTDRKLEADCAMDERVAAVAARAQWPDCRVCGATVEPGLWCNAAACPWQRVDGHVVQPKEGQ